MNKMQCNAQVTIMGVGRATAEKQEVGLFYNYGCHSSSDAYWGELRHGKSTIFRRMLYI